MDNLNLGKTVLLGLVLAGALLGGLQLKDRLFPAPPNLLLISVDTLRADHLGCYGYSRPTSPAIDRLAVEGILLERFISPRGLTDPALSTLLTGLEPYHHEVRYNFQLPEDEITLAHILGEEGYRCRAYLSNAGDFTRLGFDSIFGSIEVEVLRHIIKKDPQRVTGDSPRRNEKKQTECHPQQRVDRKKIRKSDYECGDYNYEAPGEGLQNVPVGAANVQIRLLPYFPVR